MILSKFEHGFRLFNDLQLYNAQFASIPGNLNALTDSASFNIPVYLDNTAAKADTGTGTSTYTAGNFAITTDTNGYIASSLSTAKLTNLVGLTPGTVTNNQDGTYSNTVDATFQQETGWTIAATGAKFVTDSASNGGNKVTSQPASYSIANALGYTVGTGHQLIVLGVGPSNYAVGKTLANVPVHFGDDASLQPQITYSRLLAAVDVGNAAVTANTAAKIVGIVHAPDSSDKWESIGANIESYYGS